METIRLRPRLVPKMWGGRKLETVLGRRLPDGAIGESWEVFDFPPGVIDDGAWVSAEVVGADVTLHDLMCTQREALLGPHAAVETPHGPQFPLLVKFLDAADDLSVQVHPDDAYAAAHDGAHLKNECWTILQHEPGARLLAGLADGVTPGQFRSALDDGTVEALLRGVPAELGVTHYLPSGTVHALGAGMLVAEVQTPSDTTYRVFDFNRVDPSTGKTRELHIEPAMACIDFDDPNPPAPSGTSNGVVVDAPQFTVNRRTAATPTPIDPGFAVLLCTDGEAKLGEILLRRGDVVVLPHDRSDLIVEPTVETVWLETRLPMP
ncbi:MAG: type I phosphomannose isomerase catalytic subunit [Planctomycetota bacterium]